MTDLGSAGRPTGMHEPTEPTASTESFGSARAELVGDHSVRIAATPWAGSDGRRGGRRAGAMSTAAGIGGSLLVAAIAFGAAMGSSGPLGALSTLGGGHGKDVPSVSQAATPGQLGDDGVAWTRGDGHEGGDGWAAEETSEPTSSDLPEASEPVAEPTMAPEPTTAPATKAPEPTPKPTPKPVTTTGPVLAVGIQDGGAAITWTACSGFTFDYYKVVRSTDATVSWPLGPNDALIGVVEPGGARQAWDNDAPRGIALSYRVFCVRSTDAGYVVIKASSVKTITLPGLPPAPVPDPISVTLNAALGDGGVSLSWSACTMGDFTYYKVVRSLTTQTPSYFPWTDGTELIGVISDPAQTAYTDTNVASGETVWYRIQCLGYPNGTKTLLGQSAVVAVTIP